MTTQKSKEVLFRPESPTDGEKLQAIQMITNGGLTRAAIKKILDATLEKEHGFPRKISALCDKFYQEVFGISIEINRQVKEFLNAHGSQRFYFPSIEQLSFDTCIKLFQCSNECAERDLVLDRVSFSESQAYCMHFITRQRLINLKLLFEGNVSGFDGVGQHELSKVTLTLREGIILSAFNRWIRPDSSQQSFYCLGSFIRNISNNHIIQIMSDKYITILYPNPDQDHVMMAELTCGLRHYVPA
jgi:hypothetical protein